MDISLQCCCPEAARILMELGVKQKSLFYFHHLFGMYPVLGEKEFFQRVKKKIIRVSEDSGIAISAFTVAELGHMLPDLIETNRQYEFVSIKENDCWLARYVCGNNLKLTLCDAAGEMEADARAWLLMRLLRNKIINVESVNEKL